MRWFSTHTRLCSLLATCGVLLGLLQTLLAEHMPAPADSPPAHLLAACGPDARGLFLEPNPARDRAAFELIASRTTCSWFGLANDDAARPRSTSQTPTDHTPVASDFHPLFAMRCMLTV